MTLTSEQTRKLEALRNRATLYEAVITRPDGQKRLLAYCGDKSRVGLIRALQVRSDAAWKFMGLPDDGYLNKQKGCQLVATNGCVVSFSGRTKRDVIIEGNELKYVEESKS